MRNIVIKFGLISGLILAAFSALGMVLWTKGIIQFENSEIFGYSAMVAAFVMVFVGIRRYRDSVGSGSITFGRAFKVGILITLITCAIYVVTWEIVYYEFLPDFAETYSEHHLAKMEKAGASPEAIEAERVKMKQFGELYRNPLFNVAVTFMEVFPVGLIMTLISAAILRRKPGEPPSASPAAI